MRPESVLLLALLTVAATTEDDVPPDPVHTGYFPEDYKRGDSNTTKCMKNGDTGLWGEEGGLFEGDIMTYPNDDMRTVITNQKKYWPNGTVPYYIEKKHIKTERRNNIISAIKIINERTCISLRKYRKGDPDFIIFRGNKNGCWSFVGRLGGGQVINLGGPKCFRKGTVMHEILHALGFRHQHSAYNRDCYVTIRWKNIIKGCERNFRKYTAAAVTDFRLGYDYDSVMHYARTAFSKNKKATIEPLQKGRHIGQRQRLSEKDIMKIHHAYKCRMGH